MRGHITIDARLARASGIGTYIEAVVPRVIRALPQTRFTVLGDPDVLTQVLTPSPQVRVRECRAPLYGAAEQLALARAISRDTTLFWAPHYNIPLAYRGRLAVTVHDVNHLALPQATRLRALYARAMFGAVRRRAALVLCDSRFTEQEFRRRVGPTRTTVVVHLGVSEEWFALPSAPSPVPTPYFLFVGNVKPHKNLGRLLAAFAASRGAEGHRLVIVGKRDGFLSADNDVASMAATLGERVQFTGYLPRPMLQRYVACCDALVLPSLYEGFGLPPIEAMACGRAVAVARAGSLPEVCGPEAVYFDPLEIGAITAALDALAGRAPDTDERRARRRAWARRYDWERCAAETTVAVARAAELESA